MKKIAIYGASGHGKVVADIARLNGYTDIIFIDDGDNDFITFEEFSKQNVRPIALGIGDNTIREKLYQKCADKHISVVTLIHPTTTIGTSVTIGEGTVIMSHVTVNTDTTLGKGCILNTSCVIEHDNNIGDFVHISPLVACAGNVIIGKYTHIGIGSCAVQGLTIGSNTIVGAGSVVVKDIEDNKLAYGNPCKVIKEIE